MPERTLGGDIRLSCCSSTIVCLFIGIVASSAAGQFATIVNVPPSEFDEPVQVSNDTQLNVWNAGSLPAGILAGSSESTPETLEINISGGAVGGDTILQNGTLVVRKGHVGNVYVGAETVVNVSGGSVKYIGAIGASRVTISGGTVSAMDAEASTELRVTGGVTGDPAPEAVDYLRIHPGASFTYLGGEIRGPLIADIGSEISILGREFLLDGVPIPGLDHPGDSLILDDRNALLTGTLVIGNDFEFELNPVFDFTMDTFDPHATLRLSIPTTTCGDFDFDGDVDSSDRIRQTVGWTGALLPGLGNATFVQGDCDGDGDVDTSDQNGLITNWSGAQQALELSAYLTRAEYGSGLGQAGEFDLVFVPEPGGNMLALMWLVCMPTLRRQIACNFSSCFAR